MKDYLVMDFLLVDLMTEDSALALKNKISEEEDQWYDGKLTAHGHAAKQIQNSDGATDRGDV